MPKVTCDECGTRFVIHDHEISASCPGCDAPKRNPKRTGEGGGKAKAAGVKCPMCKKTLPPGVKFCAACGVDVGTADAGDAILAGQALDAASERSRNRFWWQLWFARWFRFWR